MAKILAFLHIERSTYVLFASLALILLFWKWQSITGVEWNVANTVLRYCLLTISFLGWAMVLVGTFLINHFDLFGLRQVYLYRRGEEYAEVGFLIDSVILNSPSTTPTSLEENTMIGACEIPGG